MESQHENENHLKSLLKRYGEGRVSQREREAVDLWYDTFVDGRHTDSESPHRGAPIRRLRRWMTVAAALLLVGMSVIVLLKQREIAVQPPMQTFATDAVRKRITLPDGSVLLLNTQTRLDVPADFNEQDRRVWLAGEAFFEVAHDKRKPFVVHAGGVDTRVLGTSFNVESYPVDSTVRVAVATGSVEVSRAPEGGGGLLAAAMQPNQVLTYDRITEQATSQTEDVDKISAWQWGELNILRLTVTEIAHKLGRHFNREVVLNTAAVDNRRYTIHFVDERLEETLVVLSELTKKTFKEKGGKIIVGNR